MNCKATGKHHYPLARFPERWVYQISIPSLRGSRSFGDQLKRHCVNGHRRGCAGGKEINYKLAGFSVESLSSFMYVALD